VGPVKPGRSRFRRGTWRERAEVALLVRPWGPRGCSGVALAAI